MKRFPALPPVAAALLVAGTAFAQQAPDAGRLLRENAQPALQEPQPAPSVTINQSQQHPAAGGAKVRLTSVSIVGNTIFTQQALLAVLGDFGNKELDLAGLDDLATRLTAHYQSSGYPFARAYLPPQSIDDGKLKIEVVEGRYGQVQATGEAAFIDSAQAFLSPLRPDTVIASGALERATLLLNDQPGIKVEPLVRPGKEIGSGDLIVDVQRYQRYNGDVSLDNHGNRFTGRHRVRLNLNANSPFMLGDQLTLQSLGTDEGMWFGALGYNAPLGSSGLRGRVGYTHSYYALGGDFSSLQASGTSDVLSAGLSYPLLRSQRANLTLTTSIEHKQLHDRQRSTGTEGEKHSDVLPLSLSFDVRDRIGRAGLTYGALSASIGRLSLDSALAAIDGASARSAGSFTKMNLDVARIQSVTESVDLYARFAGQWAGKNLDSSEKFGLGGINGVRAYPSGEGYGDSGWLAQFELRHTRADWMRFAFFDAGGVKINQQPWTTTSNHRSIAGPGIGVRYAKGLWSGGVTVAWRTLGGASRSDARADSPVLWASLQRRF